MAYTNLTDEFETRHLIEWESFDELAENDKDNYLPSGTKMVFIQSASPIGWTQDVINAKAFRVVSGVSGGSTGGGSQDIGASVALAHTHAVAAHTHTITDHQHLLGHTLVTDFQIASSSRFGNVDSPGQDIVRITGVGAGVTHRSYVNRSKTDGTAASASGSGTTDSSLTTATIKYMNAIICTKD